MKSKGQFIAVDVHYLDDGGARAAMVAASDRRFSEVTHTQTVMALEVPAVIAVAPAAVSFSEPGDVETIRVFRLEPLEPLVLGRGTWHWGPFPVSADEVRLFNVQGLRYPEDNAMVDLAAVGCDVDVVLAAKAGTVRRASRDSARVAVCW